MALDPRASERRPDTGQRLTHPHCLFCGKKLDDMGYHFTCHVCGASYCYIHMARHDRAHPKSPQLVVH